MLQPHMACLALLAVAFGAGAAEPVPEIQRKPGTPQAVGTLHTLRTIPEACARLQGQFTGIVAKPYAFAAVRSSARCQARARAGAWTPRTGWCTCRASRRRGPRR